MSVVTLGDHGGREVISVELAILVDAINSMSFALAQAEQERAANLAKARRIQEHLLPQVAAIEGVKVAHTFQPASGVAGDFFDILHLHEGSLVLCIADVTGHGMAAALEAVVLKVLLLQVTETEGSPESVLRHINERFDAVSLPEDFATVFVARWDPPSGLLHYASAGHEPAYLLSVDGNRSELQSTGPPLGIQADGVWESMVVEVRRGDRLFLVTDGLAETPGAGDTMFGRDRVRDFFFEEPRRTLQSAVSEVETVLQEFRGDRTPTDDVTVVGIEFEAPPATSESIG